jgi:hypothetical protein
MTASECNDFEITLWRFTDNYSLHAEKRENNEAEDELNRLAKEDHSKRERSKIEVERCRREQSDSAKKKREEKGKNFLEDGITVTSPTEIEDESSDGGVRMFAFSYMQWSFLIPRLVRIWEREEASGLWE